MHFAIYGRGLGSSVGQAVRCDRTLFKTVGAVIFAGLISVAFAAANRTPAPPSAAAPIVAQTKPPVAGLVVAQAKPSATVKQDRLAPAKEDPLPGRPARPANIPDEPA